MPNFFAVSLCSEPPNDLLTNVSSLQQVEMLPDKKIIPFFIDCFICCLNIIVGQRKSENWMPQFSVGLNLYWTITRKLRCEQTSKPQSYYYECLLFSILTPDSFSSLKQFYKYFWSSWFSEWMMNIQWFLHLNLSEKYFFLLCAGKRDTAHTSRFWIRIASHGNWSSSG